MPLHSRRIYPTNSWLHSTLAWLQSKYRPQNAASGKQIEIVSDSCLLKLYWNFLHRQKRWKVKKSYNFWGCLYWTFIKTTVIAGFSIFKTNSWPPKYGHLSKEIECCSGRANTNSYGTSALLFIIIRKLELHDLNINTGAVPSTVHLLFLPITVVYFFFYL